MLNVNLHSHLNIHVNYQYLYTSFWWKVQERRRFIFLRVVNGIVCVVDVCTIIENLLWHANIKSRFADIVCVTHTLT